MMPVRRDVHPHLPPARICDWHERGPHVTHFINALSIFFPAGERFFMDSVRNYRDRVTDPELKQAVAGFIGQEAMHTREHILYNRLLDDAGLPASKLDNAVAKLLNLLRKVLPKSWQLAHTIALEHYTAMLAGGMLADPRHMGNSEPGYRQVWTWHALEETEHKAVAYDVWNLVMKPGPYRYLLRAFTMLTTTVTFWALVFVFHVRLVMADRTCRNKLTGFGSVVNFLWGSPGVLRKMIPEWFDYFRPGFHPWDADNRAALHRIQPLIAEIEETALRAGASTKAPPIRGAA
ncbi:MULTISPECIES: metal-dependent hydrolase [Cupriavidus]|uniref:Metal-dependent hydrolase n=1 Tax=Cupriavidus pauculus TaxID=82633 RepID=A0A3G8GXQ8_9BURK|nr:MULTISPECIES: metal-dependent hydrolase [Cupriavidus]AZG12924.1 metal-dependent hydrolase [Cupriavidus pauculus]MDT6962310.1 metal-dependent hydrolase [Cupriavidus sp. SZY C1]